MQGPVKDEGPHAGEGVAPVVEELARLGEDLGYMDITMQENTINLYLEELKGEISQTRQEAPARKKLYQALGLMAGMFLAILLV